MEETTENPGWVRHIEKRAQLVESWRTELLSFRKLSEDGCYIRVGSAGYRPISLSTANPCGRLHRRENGTVIGYSESIQASIRNAETAVNFYCPGAGKPEHSIQAKLIRHALMDDLRLCGLFEGFSDVFDELIFVTDELSAGDIRADLIALGGRNGSYFPVFIELKVVRSLGRLIDQLDKAKEAMKIAGDSFLTLLANATGKLKSNISFDDSKLLIIWRDSPSGKERGVVAEARSERYLIAAYRDTTGLVHRVP